MGLLNKVKANTVQVRLEAYKHLILGEPKTGKTTAFRDLVYKHYNGDMSKGLLVAFENGYSALDGIHAIDITCWEEWEELLDELVEERDSISYKFIALDTIDEMVAMAMDKTLRESKKRDGKVVKTMNEAFGGFQRGRDYCIALLNDSLNKLESAKLGTFMIGHTKLKKKNVGVSLGADGSEYMQLCSNLQEEYEKVFTKRADMMTYLMIERSVDSSIADVKQRTSTSKVNMVFRSNGQTASGGRFTDLPEYLPYSVDNYLKAFEQGVKGNMLKPITDDEIKEVAKKQEAEAKEQAKELRKKKTIEEMINDIKSVFPTLGDGAKTRMAELLEKSQAPNINALSEEHREIVEEMFELIK